MPAMTRMPQLVALLAMSAVMALLSSPVAGQSEYYDSCNPRAKRVDCGDVGTTQEECEASGCCWAPMYTNPFDVPWCFFENSVAGPSTPPESTDCALLSGPGGDEFLGSTWMGAGRGTVFATWAPHASAVWINGTFGGGGAYAVLPMSRCQEGFFATEVAEAVPGDAYTYVIQYMGQNLTRIDPLARAVTHNELGQYTSAVVQDPSFDWGSQSFAPPSHFEQVIYELQIPTFNPSSADGVGTFQQAVEKLDYLQLLGINVVEPIPTVEYPGSARGWGYNPGAMYAIMEAFGGYEGMKGFVKECNARGIAVYMDIVWNHVGSPCTLWQYDGWSTAYPGFPAGQEAGGVYFYENWNANTGWGARPNYANATVRRYATNNFVSFMRELHVSGFRYDSTICIRKGVINCWNDPFDNADGVELLRMTTTAVQDLGGFTIAEDLQNDPFVTDPISEGGIGFSAQWSDTTWYQYQEVLVSQDDADRSMDTFVQALEGTYTGGGAWRVIYTENHDKSSGQNAGQGRWPYMVDATNSTSYIAQKLSTLGIATVLTSPGVPMLFYGQEFLDTENFVFGDVPNLPWENVGDYSGGRWHSIGEWNGIFNLTQALVGLRLNKGGASAGLTSTDIHTYYQSDSDKVVAFTRGSDQRLVVVMNLARTAYAEGYDLGCPYGGAWEVLFVSDLARYSSAFGNVGAGVSTLQASDTPMHGFDFSLSVPLGAYTTVVLASPA